jgi:hypothetical protein
VVPFHGLLQGRQSRCTGTTPGGLTLRGALASTPSIPERFEPDLLAFPSFEAEDSLLVGSTLCHLAEVIGGAGAARRPDMMMLAGSPG